MLSRTEGAMHFTINGMQYDADIDVRTSLLDLLREHLGLAGSKKGCDHGQCGACTILVNGRRINACLTLAVMHQDDEIVTIEGLGTIDDLHPMQAASGPTAINAAIAHRARYAPRSGCWTRWRAAGRATHPPILRARYSMTTRFPSG